jgi:hypothetical protein
MTSILIRILPRQADNRFEGYRAALWLFGSFIALKLVMGVNSIFNSYSVATEADGIPIDSFGSAAARLLLMLFALTSLGQFALALVGLTVLLRYRALVPFITLMLFAEQLARRFIVQSYAVARPDSSAPGGAINLGLLALLALIVLLSLIPARRGSAGTVQV